MTARRAVVISPTNPSAFAELPIGDSLLGIPVKVPYVLTSGTLSYIQLTSNYAIPYITTSGSSTSIPGVIT